MKKLLSFSVIVFFFCAANAQVADNANNMSDSSQHHFMRREWNRNGKDSLHREFRGNRDEAMNRFGEGNLMNRFHSRGGNRFGWAHANHLHYSAEQRKQMHTINEDYRKKSQDLYKQDNITLREYKLQLLALQKDKKSKLQNLLTPDQKNEMEKWKKHASEEMQVIAAANLERMKIHLNLSDDQTAKIKSQQAEFRSQMQAIHQNENLLPYQKTDQMKVLIAKCQDAMKSVLTPEQFSQFEKMHRQRFGERFERNNMN
jgi:Spy/CpxP family protein refolding chaperone